MDLDGRTRRPSRHKTSRVRVPRFICCERSDNQLDVISVYPRIVPKPFYAAKTYKDKVVVISGASRGIGEEIAITYARCGAILSLLARSKEALLGVKKLILDEVPEAKIEIYAADVTDCDGIESAIEDTVKKFGRLDIVIPDAGKCDAWDRRESIGW